MPARFRARTLLLAVLAAAIGVAPALAAWPPAGAVVCVEPCDQDLTAALSDGAGGVYLAWEDNRSCGNKLDYVQHLDGQGNVVAGWPANGRPVCSSSVGQVLPLLVADGAGGAIAVWSDYRGGTSVYAQRFTPDGKTAWDPAGIPVCDSIGQWGPSAVADGAGGVFVAWQDTRLGLHAGPAHDPLFNFYAQHIDASGARAWGVSAAPLTRDIFNLGAPIVLSTGAAGTLVAWIKGGALDLQRLDAIGNRVLGLDGVGVAGSRCDLVCSDGAGGAFGVYTKGVTGGVDLYAMRADGAGTLLWGAGDSRRVAATPFDQQLSEITPDGTGGMYVAWNERRTGADEDAWVQRLAATGDVASGWPANGVDLAPVAGPQTGPRIVTDPSHGCIVSWQDGRGAATAYDVFAQRITPGGTVATGWPSGGVAVTHASGDQIRPALASDDANGAIVAWQDWSVDGDVYAQRVRFDGTLGVSTTNAVGPLAIESVFPNPSRAGAMSVWLSLPSRAPARLSLIDVQGRLAAREDLAPAVKGRASVSLAPHSRLAPGAYLLRLDQAGLSASRIVAVVR